MGLSELMASGGLPALASLTVMLQGRWGNWEKEMRTRVAPALEAVAGTLTHLNLNKIKHAVWLPDGTAVGYELGVAVGKLRRLQDLALGVSDDGQVYNAVAQGLAASGGDRPLPRLWRVRVLQEVHANSDLLASLLLPSVRVFVSDHFIGQAALLTACALRQAGYKHTWAPSFGGTDDVLDAIRAVLQCRFDEALVECDSDDEAEAAVPGSGDSSDSDDSDDSDA
jgi:hypothetical protein